MTNTMKRITLQVECCQDCMFCTFEKHPGCVYPTIMVNGMPMDIKNPLIIHPQCPLEDSTPKDNIPAPIQMYKTSNGYIDAVVDVSPIQ